MAGPPGGPSSGREGARGYSARFDDDLDGRLDLDRLDAGEDDAPLDLDVLGDDRPLLSEHVGAWLERSGAAPFARRHPAVMGAVAIAVVMALLAFAGWWTSRPASLADEADVVVSTGGQEPVRVVVDPATGQALGLTQLVLVTSREEADVRVDALGVVGPGLVRPTARVPRSVLGSPSTGALTSDIDCSSQASTSAVIAASAADYQVEVRRSSSTTGETRVDPVPLAGAEEWLREVRRACVQIAADRDLEVRRVEAEPVPGVVAADIRVLVRNTSDLPWRAVRVSTAGGPSVVGVTPPLDIAPGDEQWVTARLWPDDCTNPVTPLAAGVPLRAALEAGTGTTESRAPTFRLPLDRDLDVVGRALTATCTATPPTLSVLRAGVAEGALAGSSGSIDVWAELAVPDGFLVEIQEPLVDEAGVVKPLQTPVAVTDGVAALQLRWVVPQCFDLLQAGSPYVNVRVVSDLARPYRLRLGGPDVRLNLTRLCGSTVGGVVR